MGKKLVKNESDIRKKMFMPNRYDILGVVDKNYGFTWMRVICQDGRDRMCRIRGKMKKRKWVREGDIVARLGQSCARRKVIFPFY